MKEVKIIHLLTMAMHVTDESNTKEDKDPLNEVIQTCYSHTPPLPLATLLICREAKPTIMEYEKAILVMKEHNYAQAPELSEMAPFLGRLNCANNEVPLAPSDGCHLHQLLLKNRNEELYGTGDGISSYLKTMVSLQATLIHELQEQNYIQDIESNTIRREKEQLEARLERMERRLNILQKRSRDKSEQVSAEEDATASTPTTPNQLQYAKPDPITRLTRSETTTPGRRSRSRSSSADISTGKRQLQSHTTAPLEVTHRASKREQEDYESTPNTKRSRTHPGGRNHDFSCIETDIPYRGLDLELPSIIIPQKDELVEIKIPMWHVLEDTQAPLTDESCDEDITDDAYIKRHHKLEADEKRRKRWDVQRMRQKNKYEQLMKRYMEKEGLPPQEKKKDDVVLSFQPKLDDVKGINISDTVIVQAFGRPIPIIASRPFSIPNFNPHNQANKCGRGKSRRLSTTPSSNSIDEANSNSSSHVT
jgi:male-specific lethal 1